MKNPFYFTPGDRRALLILFALVIVCLSGIILFGSEEEEPEEPSAPDTLALAASGQTAPPSATAPLSATLTPSDTVLPSVFDPNTVDSSTLAALGIAPRKIHTFINYRKAGAVFRRPIDISRCYSFSDADIDLLLPRISISPLYASHAEREKYPLPSSSTTGTKSSPLRSSDTLRRSDKFSTFTKVDINTADTALLMQVPGVGETIAGMIIGLRNKFGGFTSLSQLSSIRYLTPETLRWFEVSATPSLRRININSASFKTLVTHPYIDREQANSILRYIRLYGPITSSETLLSTSIFTPAQIEQLLPYLDFSR